MAIAPIITGGFGSFADVYDIPVFGFSIGAAATGTTPDGLDFAAVDTRPHYGALDWRPHYRVEDGRPHLSIGGWSSATVVQQVAETDEDGFAEELEQGGLSLME